MALREIRRNLLRLSLAQPIQVAHEAPFRSGPVNQAGVADSIGLMGPEPNERGNLMLLYVSVGLCPVW